MLKKPSFLMGFGEKTSYNYPFSWGGGGSKCSKNLHFSWVLVKKQVITTHFLGGGGGFKMFKKPSFLMGFGEKTSYNYPFSWGGGVQNVQKTFISHGFW